MVTELIRAVNHSTGTFLEKATTNQIVILATIAAVDVYSLVTVGLKKKGG